MLINNNTLKTTRERVRNTLNFKKCADRLPMVEWVSWWKPTVERWRKEGLNPALNGDEINDEFGLDKIMFIGAWPVSEECPRPTVEGGSIVTDLASYEKIKKYLFTEKSIEQAVETAKNLKDYHEKGEAAVRFWMDGCFWFPRSLLGIEGHLFAFYDQAELLHRMNEDLTRFNIKVFERVSEVLIPEFVALAEDMSYNHGPMLSYELFKEFLLPYYRRLVEAIKPTGCKILVDSDGDVTEMISWILEAGIDGIYPHERQAGVDIVKIREQYPELIMMGGFDKMVMDKGEEAIRAEFERIFPVMKSGGFIPSVDHQTPPNVSLDDYRLYLKLFKEYCTKAVK